MNLIKLTELIDNENYQFTSKIKQKLQNLNDFSERGLEWLMMEHYQFSLNNTHFLLKAADTTQILHDQGVQEELKRNYEEEKNHAKFYKKALFEIGTDIDSRIEFNPTTLFFESLSQLISTCPSTTLGAMYATETAAIFEHEVFFEISREVILRRNYSWPTSRLKAFHDLHLNGVEQAHKDELGVFIDLTESTHNEQQRINKNQVYSGAKEAIHSMNEWWNSLLTKTRTL